MEGISFVMHKLEVGELYKSESGLREALPVGQESEKWTRGMRHGNDRIN